MTNYAQYWADNTFEMHYRVAEIKRLLKSRAQPNATLVRVGSNTDGGYIVSDDITAADYVVSFGVDTNVDFEAELQARYDCFIDLYDYTVKDLPQPIPYATFYPERIGVEPGDTTLATCLSRAQGDTILKIDIEGSEWDVLAQAEDLTKCRQILVEFHWLQNLQSESFYLTAFKALANLRANHTPVWIHANNNVPLMVMGNSPVPMVFEVLYLRTDSYTWTDYPDLPGLEGLTTRNDANFPEIALTFP